MKITRELRRQINAAVKAKCGANPLAEVGYRGPNDSMTCNALLWPAGEDLNDMYRLSSIKEIEDDAANPGCHVLDLYVTSGRGFNRELETNVYIAIRDGQLVLATTQDLKVPQLLRDINFPLGAGWLAE